MTNLIPIHDLARQHDIDFTDVEIGERQVTETRIFTETVGKEVLDVHEAAEVHFRTAKPSNSTGSERLRGNVTEHLALHRRTTRCP